MKKIVNIAIIIALGLGFNGCAIKQDDSIGMQTAKHIVNSPGYALVGVGFVATKATEMAIITAIGVPALAYKKAKEAAEKNNNTESIEETSVE